MRAPVWVAWLFISLPLFFGGTAWAASVDEWRTRSVYQLLTDRYAYPDGTQPGECNVADGLYCGGTWKGIKDNLDYIQGMNFDAVWISPIVQQLPQKTGDGEAYTAYWQQNLYELNDRFGTRQDLHDLVTELHKRDMLLMLDIVVNHMGYAGPGWLVDHSVLYPFNDTKYFHSYCPITEADNLENIEVCYLGDYMVTLADVATERQDVQEMYAAWISELVSNYSIDGLRIDTSINVNPSFFPDFVEAAGIFATGEALNGDSEIACQWEGAIGSILNYPVYFPLIKAFTDSSGSIDDLVEAIQDTKTNCQDATALGSFSENHDQPRFTEYTNDTALAKNVIAYTILADGIPIIYQGQEQHMVGGVTPYLNRAPLWQAGYNTSAPLYTHIATLNTLRQHAIATSVNYTTYDTWPIWQDYHSLALRKGYNGSQVVTVLTNNGELAQDYTLEIPNHGFPAGVQLTEILSCTNLTVNGTGYINLPMTGGDANVLYPTHLLYNSSLCGMPEKDPSGGSNEPQTTITTALSTTVSGHATMLTTTTEGPAPVTSLPTVSQPTTTGHHTGHPTVPPGSATPLGGANTLAIPDFYGSVLVWPLAVAAFTTLMGAGFPAWTGLGFRVR